MTTSAQLCKTKLPLTALVCRYIYTYIYSSPHLSLWTFKKSGPVGGPDGGVSI